MTSGRRELRSQPCSTRDGALPLCCMARGRPASQANCRIGIVGEAGVAAAEGGPGGDLVPEFLPYLEVVGDRAEQQDGRRFSPDVFRAGDGAAAVIALRDSDMRQGVVNAVVHVLGALIVRRGAGRLRRGEGGFGSRREAGRGRKERVRVFGLGLVDGRGNIAEDVLGKAGNSEWVSGVAEPRGGAPGGWFGKGRPAVEKDAGDGFSHGLGEVVGDRDGVVAAQDAAVGRAPEFDAVRGIADNVSELVDGGLWAVDTGLVSSGCASVVAVCESGERWHGAFRPGLLWRICDSGFRRASGSAEAPSGPEWRLAWPGAATAYRADLRVPDAGVGHEFRDPAVGGGTVTRFQAKSTERPLRGPGVACWPGHGSDWRNGPGYDSGAACTCRVSGCRTMSLRKPGAILRLRCMMRGRWRRVSGSPSGATF